MLFAISVELQYICVNEVIFGQPMNEGTTSHSSYLG